MSTKPLPLTLLAAAARALSAHAAADAAEHRDLARAATKRGSTHVSTRRTEVAWARRRAKQLEQDAVVLRQMADVLAVRIVPDTGGKVPRGFIEFRVYEGGGHSFNWKALRGGNIIAHATGYDRKRDSVRQLRSILAAIHAGKVVITTAGKGGRRA